MRYYLTICCCICLLFSCKKDNKGNSNSSGKTPDSFSVTLTAVGNSNVNDFSLKGSLQITHLSQPVEYGFIFSAYADVSLYQGKVIGIGKSKTPLDYSYDLTGLDTGKTFYCRAYALLNGNVVYSPVMTVGKVSPVITGVTIGDTTSNPTSISISTNFHGLLLSDKISLFLGTQELKLISTDTSSAGTRFLTSYPGVLPPGAYNFVIHLNAISTSYTKTILLPTGAWNKYGELSYNQTLYYKFNSTFVKDGWIYSLLFVTGDNPDQDTIRFIKQNIQSGIIVPLHTYDNKTFIYNPAVVFDGNNVHFIGGYEYDLKLNACVNTHFIYNITADTWTKEANFPGQIRRNGSIALYNGKIYYGMGYVSPTDVANDVDRNDIWSYDLQTQKWQQLSASYPGYGKGHAATFVIGSKMYVVAGLNRIAADYSTWCYDMAANTWTQKANFPGDGYQDAACFQLGQYGYVGLGSTGVYDYSIGGFIQSTHFFRYDPANNQWTQLPDLDYAPAYPICGVNGKYGIIAGQDIYTYTP